MEERLNPTIVRWIAKGKIKEALLGESPYFLPDNTFRTDHDVLLVIYVLIRWAFHKNKQLDCANDFTIAIQDISEANIIKGLEILLAYLIVSRDLEITLPIDPCILLASIENKVINNFEATNDRGKKVYRLLEEIKRRTS